jgi:MFS family permease
MIHDIREYFKITAEQFSTLGFFYLLGYSLLQIPLGIVVDRVGVRVVALYSVVICIIGSLLFGVTEHFWVAQVARFIIGIGSASAFMCALKYVADHLPPGKRGFLMGATLTIGMVGALITGKLVKSLDSYMSWQDMLALSGVLGILAFILISITVKPVQVDHYAQLNHKNFKETLLSIKNICLSRNIMLYAILAIGLYTPLSALADLWGTAFVKQKFGLDKFESANTAMMMYVGLAFGSLILPIFAEKFNKLNEAIILCGFCILLIFSTILYLPPVSYYALVSLFILLGFFCGAEMMCFTGTLNYSKKFDSGEIIGVVNTLNMLGGAIVQYLIGWSLDLQWSGLIDHSGVRQYTTEQFEYSLSTLTAVVFVCCLISFPLLKIKQKRI